MFLEELKSIIENLEEIQELKNFKGDLKKLQRRNWLTLR